MNSILKISVLAFLSSLVLFAQQPMGWTKYTFKNPDNSWHIGSDTFRDGATGGSLFFDNYPYVQIDKRLSYWVAGKITKDHGVDYEETNTYTTSFSNECIVSTSVNVYNGSPTHLASGSHVFFQLYHSDFLRYGRDDTRIQFSRSLGFIGQDTVETWAFVRSSRFDQHKPDLPPGAEIRYVAVFVDSTDEIGDPRIDPSARQGMFLYFRIMDAQGDSLYSEDPISDSTCINNEYTAKDGPTHRVYIGSDSHGNIQNWTSSLTEWNNLYNSQPKQLDCNTADEWSRPFGTFPLLGDVYRTIFIQGVPTKSMIDNFLANPDSYNHVNSSEVRLDFPSNIYNATNGYTMVIPNSHWTEYASPDSGKLISKPFINYPNTEHRSGLRIKYTGSNPTEYGINYDLVARANIKDRLLYKKVSFFLGKDNDTSYTPNFHLYVRVTLDGVVSSEGPPLPPTKDIYIQCSPNFSTNSYTAGYLKLTMPPQNGNDNFDHYEKDLQQAVWDFRQQIGYSNIKLINNIKFRGAFDMGGVVFSESNVQKQKTAFLGIIEEFNEKKYSISHFPNPFNPETTIQFTLAKAEYVKLRVFNSLGQEIVELFNEFTEAGHHEVKFNGSNISSGIYFYIIEAGDFV